MRVAPVCVSCGHKHYGDFHADHNWIDSCPYVGISCLERTTIEGSGVLTHEPVVFRNPDGFLTIDWHGKDINPGDRVLMSAELFAESIRAMNQLAGTVGEKAMEA